MIIILFYSLQVTNAAFRAMKWILNLNTTTSLMYNATVSEAIAKNEAMKK